MENAYQTLLQLVQQLFYERNQPSEAQTVAHEAQAGNLDQQTLWKMFRALVNTRPATPASDEFLALQDLLLKHKIEEAGIATLADARPAPNHAHLYLWKGDITTLATDGIVNAANAQMLGCWIPGHYCIDNAIHTFAGVQLRIECARIMQEQGYDEPTGQAKVTPAFNLPSHYIVHTVGPIAGGNPSDLHRAQLESSYRSCLDAAAQHNMGSLAFCCISTGVFGFPQEEAAHIAVSTVTNWLSEHPESGIDVVFNVFGDTDEAIYQQLLGFNEEG